MIEFDFKLIENDSDLSNNLPTIEESMLDGEGFSDTLKRDLETIDENRVATLSIEGAKEFHQWLAFQMFWEFDYWGDTQKLGLQERRFLEPDLMQTFVKLNQIGIDLENAIEWESVKDVDFI